MITFKQFLEAIEPIKGAKNFTGVGSDTQAGANKAKVARTGNQGTTDRTSVTRPNLKPTNSASKYKLSLKNNDNADKLEAKLKQGNISYTKNTTKDGIEFSFKDDNGKRNATRIASSSIDKTKEDIND